MAVRRPWERGSGLPDARGFAAGTKRRTTTPELKLDVDREVDKDDDV